MDITRFSVIIPLYNKAAHIERSIWSVLGQTCKNFELIIVDDGSTDGGGGIVNKIDDSRIKVVRQKNLGVSAARNRGVHEANYDFVAFLDADDEWKPTFLTTILRLMQCAPTAGMYGAAYEISELMPGSSKSLKKVNANFKGEGYLTNYFKLASEGNPPFCSSSVVVSKKAFIAAGEFVVGEKYGEDLSLWGRIALKYPVALSDEVGSVYHKDTSNRACGRHKQSREWSFVPIAEKFLQENPDGEFAEQLIIYLDRVLMRMAIDNILLGNGKFARRLTRKISGRSNRLRKNVWFILSVFPVSITNLIARLAIGVK